MTRQPVPHAAPPLAALRRFGALLRDLIYPPRCAGCGRLDHALCPACTRVCARPFTPLTLPPLPALTGCAATGDHRGVLRELVQALKYSDGRFLADPLGRRLAHAYLTLNWTIDLVIPVPLHMTRQRERGYNQSEVIGAVMAQIAQLPLHTTLLTRSRATRSQVGLTGEERRHNLTGAFTCVPGSVQHQRVLLIDDVFTTGSTLNTCAEVLHAAGAAAVYSLTVTTARR